MKPTAQYKFFVQALNSDGWSNFSEQSEEFEFNVITTGSVEYEIWLYVMGGIIFLMLIVFFSSYVLCSKYTYLNKCIRPYIEKILSYFIPHCIFNFFQNT
jgi:hypothetical protein